MVLNALEGKVVIITGAASGIGRAAARLFARNGAAIVIGDVDDDAADEVIAEIRDTGGKCVFQHVDVRDSSQCAALVQAAMTRFGRLDAAFNNAGVAGPMALTAQLTLEQWRDVIDLNLTGTFNCVVHEVRGMQATGGAIVNTASIKGFTGARGASAYSASKHGILGLTRSAALEYGKQGIRINAVCPGYVATPMTTGSDAALPPGFIEKALSNSAVRRMAHPDEVAELVLWLCSAKSSYVTGAHFVVDGGVTA
jgi:NAD(P)-dependent dehydrogenase (short-subunit alcohol dehydrogenase family)